MAVSLVRKVSDLEKEVSFLKEEKEFFLSELAEAKHQIFLLKKQLFGKKS